MLFTFVEWLHQLMQVDTNLLALHMLRSSRTHSDALRCPYCRIPHLMSQKGPTMLRSLVRIHCLLSPRLGFVSNQATQAHLAGRGH